MRQVRRNLASKINRIRTFRSENATEYRRLPHSFSGIRGINKRAFHRAKNSGHRVTPLRNHSRLGAAALITASAALAANTSFAVPRYDGVWSVSTTKGDCIASYRYPMRVANGVLANGGDLAINVSARVAPSGAIRVTLSHGDTRTAASGRLSGSVGRGSWTAQRRSS
jgi:hypothetical protein